MHDKAGCILSGYFSRHQVAGRGAGRYDERFGFTAFTVIGRFDTGIADVEAENERVHEFLQARSRKMSGFGPVGGLFLHGRG